MTHRPQVHGHRGCRGLFPENTLPAFLHALQLGVDAIELDVVLSADRQVVVAHEPWLAARLGLSPTGLPISPQHERELNIYALPYATIRQSVVGTLPHPSFPEQQQIPTYRPLLTEVFRAVESSSRQLRRSPVGYSIEIKSTAATDNIFHPHPPAFVAAVLGAIPPELLPRVTLLSFDTRILQEARRQQPLLRLCLLVEETFSTATVFAELGFVPNIFGPHYGLLSLDILSEFATCYPEAEVVPWTVNSTADLQQLITWPVTGVTTDYPNRLLQML